MAATRTAWHVIFAELLKERAPPGIDVIPEVVLTTEPQRADLLLLRREGERRRDDQARVLRGLWPRLGTDTLVEFKSAARPPRRGDWIRLGGYGCQYHAREIERLDDRNELTLVLVVAAMTPTLRAEAEMMGWTTVDLGGGYARVDGMPYPSFLVEIDLVSEAERDDLLGLFGKGTMLTNESLQWWHSHTLSGEGAIAMNELEGYDDVVKKVLASIPIEKRLEDLSPADRRRAAILALPDEDLRALVESDFVKTLPEDVQAEIRKRLAH